MKLSAVIVLFFCGTFHLSCSENLNCEFKVLGIYTCVVTSLENTNNSMVITGYSGYHEPNKSDTDVTAISIRATNTTYIPKSLGFLFHLTVLEMFNTQLVEIKTRDFNEVVNLEELYLGGNRLTSIPIDAFSTLIKLIIVDLNHNQIEELQNGVFANNVKLEEINLAWNQIQFLGSSLFDGLTELNYVELRGNICVNQAYYNSTGITELKNDIQLKCTNPTTQNPTDAPSITFDNVN